ncbi:MAG: RecF/RecN/SMC N-terminal protein [Mycobacterium sp.]|nr:RecF/RecN/SMC N-terminal protein [Mycobacterium sp.]
MANDHDTLTDQARLEALRKQHAAALTAPDVGTVQNACAALRFAAAAQADAERTADVLSADRVQFLETSLEFHDRHGRQPCPVCATGTLDDEWVTRARAALAEEHDSASALRVARSGAHRARQALIALVRAVDAPPDEDAGLTTAAAARAAHQSISALSADDDTALADLIERELPGLRSAYDALREAAASALGINR